MNNLKENTTKQAIENIISSKTVNLKEELLIDFFINIPSENVGSLIAKEIEDLNFMTSIEYDEEESNWTCYCSKNLFLDYNTIIEIENLLDTIAKKYGGNIDGFGTYGNL